MRQRACARRTNLRIPGVDTSRCASQYLVGSSRSVGHSINSHSATLSGCSCLRQPCAAQTFSSAKRELWLPLVPSRQTTLRQAVEGSSCATVRRAFGVGSADRGGYFLRRPLVLVCSKEIFGSLVQTTVVGSTAMT